MAYTFCPQCRSEVSIYIRNCSNCGFQLKQPEIASGVFMPDKNYNYWKKRRKQGFILWVGKYSILTFIGSVLFGVIFQFINASEPNIIEYFSKRVLIYPILLVTYFVVWWHIWDKKESLFLKEQKRRHSVV